MKLNYMTVKVILINILFFHGFVSFAQVVINDNNSHNVQIYNVKMEIFDLLYRQQIDFIKLYNERTLVEAKSVNGYCFNIILHLKGGMPERAINEMKEMKRKYPHIPNISDLHFEVKEYSQPKVLNTLLTLYPSELQHLLLDYLKLVYSEEKWSFEKIICWIDSIPNDKNLISFYNDHFDSRLHLKKDFYCWVGKEKEFVTAIIDSIKNIDQDVDKSLIYLNEISNLELTKYDIDFKHLAQFIKPKYSTDAYLVAGIFEKFNSNPEALQFCEIALNTELTDKDYTYLHFVLSNKVSREVLKQNHEYEINRQICNLLIRMGRNEDAHAIMMKDKRLINVGEKEGNYHYAGIVQGETGITKIEREIIRGKRRNKGKIQYWMNRSDYYEGRGNYSKTEKALIKGINVLKRTYSMDTLYLINEYEDFIRKRYYLLGETKSQKIAFEFYFKELQKIPLASELAGSIIHSISALSNKEYELTVWDSIYWNYLKENDDWSDNLISRLLTDCYPNERDSIFFKLNELAKNHAQKAYALALNDKVQKHYPKEAIELLMFVRNYESNLKRETNWDNYGTKQKIDFVNQTLTKLFIETKDFKRAEILLYKIDDMPFILQNIEKMAILLFQQENYEESYRLWHILSNINPSNLELLSKLSNSRMNEYFAGFYENISELLPESYLPGEAFKIINQRKEE